MKRHLILLAIALIAANLAVAANPVVKTVPWVASNALIPHDTFAGKMVTLKGTSDTQGFGINYIWDFGDGSPVATGTVTNQYVIAATHTYAGAVGTIFTARLTVNNTNTGETGSQTYFVAMRAKSLDVEVNVAIDEGLWYLHATQRRFVSGTDQLGVWDSTGLAASGNPGINAANVNAFEVNGHLENGNPANPYVDTVARGMRQLFNYLSTIAILSSQTNAQGTFNPDGNGNGYGVSVVPFSGRETYQLGMFMDAIVASGTPNAVTTTGALFGGPGIRNRTYSSIVQDMVDTYAYGQYDGATGGGWYYTLNNIPDNSISQWAAIGIIAADRFFGATVPQIVKNWNQVWITNSQQVNGQCGYQSSSPIWGPYATTPSCMVQLAMDGVGRGDMRWDHAETFLRDNFHNPPTHSTTSIKLYYYGMFSFVKSMLLHDSNGDKVAEPIALLQSATAGVNPIDWYTAEKNANPNSVNNTDGIARTLVNGQNAGGYWTQHSTQTSEQWPFETAWAIIMLNRTIFTAGAPVAVATANPNPAVAGQTINLSGAGSFHQDPSKQIVMWEWDLNNDGIFETSGVNASVSFPVIGNYPVRLRVTDNASPASQAVTTLTLVVSTPPVAPTANAGGPYSFCQNRTPWFLDGTGSVNPDDGQHEPGAPGDFITSYSWDLNGDNVFGDAVVAQPDVTTTFSSRIGQSFIVSLKVTDNTAMSFPSSGMGNLSSTATAQVSVRASTDPACACITNLAARARDKQIQLTWLRFAGATAYNVYRSTTSGGPYVKIATTASTYSTYLDTGLTNGVTYYYVVRPTQLNGNETCQSNQASGTPKSL